MEITKTMLIAITFILGGLSAQAANIQTMSLKKVDDNKNYQSRIDTFDTIFNATDDKFQQILEIANQSQATTFNDAEGVYTGRCYNMATRNYPSNSSLLIGEFTTEHGPIFPSEKIVIVGRILNPPPLDFADSKTKKEIISELLLLKGYFSNLIENPLSVSTNNDKYIMTFFRYKNYILKLETLTEDAVVRYTNGDYFYAKKGDVTDACYYFNKK